MSPTRSRVHLVHPGHAILRLKPRRFTKFAAHRLRKLLAAGLAKLSTPTAPRRRSSHLTRGRSFMHDKNNSNSRGKTTGAALDKRLF
jgi:hypothetical protein